MCSGTPRASTQRRRRAPARRCRHPHNRRKEAAKTLSGEIHHQPLRSSSAGPPISNTFSSRSKALPRMNGRRQGLTGTTTRMPGAQRRNRGVSRGQDNGHEKGDDRGQGHKK
jgi:hypothetical protein